MDLTPENIRAIVDQVTRELATRSPGGAALGAAPGMGRAVGRSYGSRAPAEGYRAVNVGPGSAAGASGVIALAGSADASGAYPALPDPDLRANLGPRSARGVFS